MRSWSLWVGVLLHVLLAATADARQQAGTAPNDTATVRLEFGWKPGMSARVETWRRRARTTAGKTDSSSVAMRYRLRVEPHAEGLLVAFGDAEVLGAKGLPFNDGSEAVQGALQLVSSMLPNFIVDTSGEIRRLENVTEMRVKMDSLLAMLTKTMGDAFAQPRLQEAFSQPQFRELLGNLTSEATLTRTAALKWNMIVGFWVGGEFEPGAVERSDVQETISLLGGAKIPMTYEFSLEAREKCTDLAGSPTCVVLQMRSLPRPEAMKQALDDFMKRMITGDAAAVPLFESLSIVNTVVVSMEPATMRPHRLTVEKRVTGSLRVSDTDLQQVSQVDTRSTRFEWGR